MTVDRVHVLRLELHAGSGMRSRGTGFLIRPGLMLTALHVVADCDRHPVEFLPGPMTIHVATLAAKGRFAFHSIEQKAPVPLNWDREEDWVLLEVPDDLQAVVLPHAPANELTAGAHWSSYGFPDANPDDGCAIGGQLRTKAAALLDVKVLQLFSSEAAAGNGMPVRGISGAPVAIDGRVIGLVRRGLSNQERMSTQIPRSEAGTLFACPIDAVNRALGSRLSSDRQGQRPADRLIEGMRALKTDYAWRVKHFLEEYLGHDDSRVPFGGRENVLRTLDGWLEAGRESFALMVAPAGQGKSALLVRWAAQLVMRQDVAVAFVPISIRFETNLANVTFAVLAAQLASLHGEQIPSASNVSIDEWRAVVCQYLERPPPPGRRVVVILDGLDEAAGFLPTNVIPRMLPIGVRVIVTARLRAGDVDAARWLTELNWQVPGLAKPFPLPPLTLEGISDVLVRMDVPLDVLGRTPEIVSTLHRVTGGDPLLISLYVKLLQAQGEGVRSLTADALREMEPGIKGYIELWWRDQKTLWGPRSQTLEPAAQALLNILACALGPLSRNDMSALLAEDQVSSLSLDTAFGSLERLVIGDGQGLGYVFSHPKVAAYFYDRLHQSERDALERRFLAYGRRTLDMLATGALDPGAASVYVVQRYGAHLERARCGPEEFLPLAANSWRQAWEAVEGSQAGFLSDVERAYKATLSIDRAEVGCGRAPRFVSLAVRWALCRASVNSLAYRIHPMLASALVQYGRWTPAQGLTFVRQIPDDERRTEAIALIAPHLPERERRVTVEDLLSMSTRGSEAWTRAIEVLAPHIPEVLLPLAIEAVEKIDSPWLRSRIIKAIAERIPARQLDAALQIADGTLAPLAAAQALAALVPRFPDASRRDLVENVLAKLDSVSCTELHGFVLASIVPNVSGAALSALLDAGRRAKRPEIHSRVVEAVARHSCESERPALALEARAAAQQVAQCETRAALLTAIARLLPDPERTDVELEALAAIESIQDPWTRARELARHPEVKGERIIQLVKTLRRKRSDRQLLALADLSCRLPPKMAQSVWKFIVSNLTALDEDSPVSDIVRALAPLVPDFALKKMLKLAYNTGDKEANFHAISVLAARLPPQQRDIELDKALRASQAILDSESIALAAVPLVQHLDHSELRAKILALACASPASTERQLAVAEIVPRLWGVERDGAAEQAASNQAVLKDPGWGKDFIEWDYDAIIALAPHLPQAQLVKVLDRLDELEDRNRRDSILAKLVPHLTPVMRDRELTELIKRRADDKDEDAYADMDADAEINRADLLVKVGRWLPLDLLPDAFPMVTEMYNEERSLVLVEFLNGPIREYSKGSVKPRPIALTAAADYLAVSIDPSRPEDAQRLSALALSRLCGHKRRGDRRQMAVLALAELAPYVDFDEEDLQHILNFVSDMRAPEIQAEVLFKLAAALDDVDMVSDGFAALMQIRDRQRRLELMKLIAPYLYSAMLAATLQYVSEINDPSIAAEVTARLLPGLDGDAHFRALEEGLAYAHRVSAADRKAKALTKLALSTTGPTRDAIMKEALEAAFASATDAAVDVLDELVPLLSDAALNTALERIGVLHDARTLERFPAALAARLSAGQVERSLALLQNSSQRWYGKVLGRLPIERLPHLSLMRVIEGALSEMSTGMRNEAMRLLATLYPALIALGGRPTMIGVAHALVDVGGWWP